MSTRRIVFGYVLIVFIAVFPLLSAGIAASVAKSHNCVLNEGTAHPCVIGGHDYGSMLYNMGVMGWLMFISFPFAFLAFVGFTIYVVVRSSKKKPPVYPFK